MSELALTREERIARARKDHSAQAGMLQAQLFMVTNAARFYVKSCTGDAENPLRQTLLQAIADAESVLAALREKEST